MKIFFLALLCLVYLPKSANAADEELTTEEVACQRSNECPAANVCVREKCVSKSSPLNQCYSAIDCGWPAQCRNRRCLEQGDPECRSNYDCHGGKICVNRKCVYKNDWNNRCHSNFDCGFPHKCVNGKCQ
ncbi:MAG TPA: hypothetical protein VIH99_06830 [Bdellovibrionota bacterium]